MINIEKKHLDIVLAILKKYPYTFYAFGSRVSEKVKRFSDLDLCFVENIPLNLIIELEGEFEDSDLPYKVDLVDWHHCNGEFKRIIQKNSYRLQGNAELMIIE